MYRVEGNTNLLLKVISKIEILYHELIIPYHLERLLDIECHKDMFFLSLSL